MTERRTGMDHAHYRYSPLPTRPPLAWPDGARVAFWVLLHLEYWELDPPKDAVRDARFVSEFGNYFPDYRTWSQREYGNRVGIFRILETLDRHGIKATVAANSSACERYPALIEECTRRGWEFCAHGTHATRAITSRMSEAEERAYIAGATDAAERATGRRPTGWLGQDLSESPRTPRLLAELGFDHVMDWANDDQPYLMTTEPPLVALPAQIDWDDAQLFWLRRVETWRYPALVGEAYDTLAEEGGRVFGLSLHPWLFGMAHRIRYLDEALARLAATGGFWHATASEIATWTRRAVGEAK